MSNATRLLEHSGEIPADPTAERAYFDHPFEVPLGVSKVVVKLQYHRPTPEWDLILLVFGPDGFRADASLDATRDGPAGNVELTEVVSASDPGADGGVEGGTSGEWLIQIWAGHVNRPLRYQVLVDAIWESGDEVCERDSPQRLLSLDRVICDDPGWYLGELHTHTTASDGYLTVGALVELARSSGLAFLAVTDHNTINACRDLAAVRDLCVIPSLEVTVPQGHCNLFGLHHWVDWRAGYHGWTMKQVMEEARAQNAVVSVNHPFAPEYSWHADVPLGLIDCIEILNYPSWWPAATEYNQMALGLWTSMLNAGHQITAVGGSDAFHLPPGEKYPGSPYREAMGQPATCVFANDLSPVGILDGLRRGRAYVTMGPVLELKAVGESRHCTMGEWIGPVETLALTVKVHRAPPGSLLRCLKNGRAVREQALSGSDANFTVVDTPDPGRHNWYRVDLFNRAGEIWAVSNPVYAGKRPTQPRDNWTDALERARSEGMIQEQTIFE